MDVASAAIAVATIAVNFGWQPSPEDPNTYEVVMQVEPELVDVLEDGRQIPLECHVPESVTPIRSVRVVVGTGNLPHTSIAAQGHERRMPPERIVRGQEESPLRHTTRFQGDGSWSGDRYAPTTAGGNNQFEQRGATIGVEPIRTAQANPWTIEGAQQAVGDTSNSLRKSLNSGIQQVNQQFNQSGQNLLDSTKNTASEFGQQLQNVTGLNSPTSPPPSVPATSRTSQDAWPAPPPPQTSSPTAGAVTPNTWSSIQPQLAPPRLPAPAMPNSLRLADNSATARSNSGPTFPPPPTTGDPQTRSLLSSPNAAGGSAAEQDWASVWGPRPNASSVSSDNDTGVGLVPVPPRLRSETASVQPTANDPDAARWAWPSPSSSATAVTANTTQNSHRYSAPLPVNPATTSGADTWANFGLSPDIRASIGQPPSAHQQPLVAAPPEMQPNAQQAFDNQPFIAAQSPAVQPTHAEEVPWKPLLAVSLALAGSLGANLFLGWSYADARQRYQRLVLKTTRSFQKAAGLAA